MADYETMTDYENFAVDHDAGVARVTMESTSRMNSLTPRMAEELLEVATALGEDDEVRCIALTGSDGAYGAGADLSRLDGDERDATYLRRMASTLHDAIVQFHQAEKPIVTGVDGVAAGAGFSLAIMGDLVLMSEDARLEFAYHRIGLTGDGGSTFFLPRIVGLRNAMEIVLLDEPIDADRAVELGLANEAVAPEDLDGRLDELAGRLATGPTRSLGRTKRLLVESFGRDLPGQLAAETETIARSAHTEDYERGIAAFFEEEPAEFVGR